MEQPDASVVVVTYNALPWIERCLDSVRGREVVVVDHGSTDGTLAVVRERYPDVRIVEQGNKGMGAGNNTGMEAATGRYFFLLNSDAWVVGDGLDRLVAYADAHPDAAVVGPRLRNRDGTLQRSVRAEPTLWRLATEYLFIRKLAPRSRLLNPLYAGGFDHETEMEADWLYGAALLVRRAAVEEVGPFDEAFFMFSEEVDWMTRFRRAGWKILFYPGAEVVHVGGATHGGRMYVENLRGHLRWFAKHRGPKAAERVRVLLLWSLRLRALVVRREAYREGIRFLSSGDAATLVSRSGVGEAGTSATS
jgi:N-acetylglucosaminyl-diphospho-decaprenol L-rhamnosyltransferase